MMYLNSAWQNQLENVHISFVSLCTCIDHTHTCNKCFVGTVWKLTCMHMHGRMQYWDKTWGIWLFHSTLNQRSLTLIQNMSLIIILHIYRQRLHFTSHQPPHISQITSIYTTLSYNICLTEKGKL